MPEQVSAKYREEKSLSLPTIKPYSSGLYSYVIPLGLQKVYFKYSRTRLKRHRFIWNLTCRVRHYAIPINSTLLTNVILLGYIDARLKRHKIFSLRYNRARLCEWIFIHFHYGVRRLNQYSLQQQKKKSGINS